MIFTHLCPVEATQQRNLPHECPSKQVSSSFSVRILSESSDVPRRFLYVGRCRSGRWAVARPSFCVSCFFCPYITLSTVCEYEYTQVWLIGSPAYRNLQNRRWKRVWYTWDCSSTNYKEIIQQLYLIEVTVHRRSNHSKIVKRKTWKITKITYVSEHVIFT